MPARPAAADRSGAVDDALAPLVLLVGDEELRISRAVGEIAAAARSADAGLTEIERAGSDIDGSELPELLGPSLFGDSRLLVIVAAQDLRAAAVAALQPYLDSATPGITLVLQHAGGAKGKAVLQAARKAGAVEIACTRLVRFEERTDFVRSEVARAGGRIDPAATAALVDAVGSDLRELAAAAAQLVTDAGGRVDVDAVRAYYRGRAEVSGFAVADLAVAGRAGPALEALRFALAEGVPHVVIADAIADGVRSVARVAGARRTDPNAMASALGMPTWKLKRALGQARGWSEPGLRRALAVVADLNADVKGVAVDPGYAIERALRLLADARAA